MLLYKNKNPFSDTFTQLHSGHLHNLHMELGHNLTLNMYCFQCIGIDVIVNEVYWSICLYV